MSDTLAKICADKREHVTRCEAQTPLSEIRDQLKDADAPRGFIKKLSSQNPALIAEVKKASPSRGVIREDFDPVTIAQTYESAGAACLSVLTDEPYFQGKDEYLVAIHEAVSLPLLRKDFMIDPYQIYESRALGADCILLIMAALEDALAKDLYDLAADLNMDVLVEVHNREELERALKLSPRMIGVNNRNLKTLEVDLRTGLDLAALMPADMVKVAESGIYSPENIHAFQQAGYNAFLVGESLMREDDIAAAVKKLLKS